MRIKISVKSIQFVVILEKTEVTIIKWKLQLQNGT